MANVIDVHVEVSEVTSTLLLTTISALYLEVMFYIPKSVAEPGAGQSYNHQCQVSASGQMRCGGDLSRTFD